MQSRKLSESRSNRSLQVDAEAVKPVGQIGLQRRVILGPAFGKPDAVDVDAQVPDAEAAL